MANFEYNAFYSALLFFESESIGEKKGFMQSSKLIAVLGWGLLAAGLVLYVFPVFYQFLGFYSGLLAFVLIFIGISLLKYRKDQLNR